MLRLNTEVRTLESFLIYPSPGQEGYFLLGHDYMVNETSLYYLRFPFCLELSEQRPVCWHSPEGGWRQREEQISSHRLSNTLLQSNNLMKPPRQLPGQGEDVMSCRSIGSVHCILHSPRASLHRWEMWGSLGCSPPACLICRAQHQAGWDGSRGLCPKQGRKQLCDFLLTKRHTDPSQMNHWKQKKNVLRFLFKRLDPFCTSKV